MVCSVCSSKGHNKRTCPGLFQITDVTNITEIPRAEKRAAKALAALLFEPKVKKVNKPLLGLQGCQNIWKEEPKKVKKVKGTKCGVCGENGHNVRRCPLKCIPCTDQMVRSYCFAGMTQAMAVKMTRVLECESIYGETEDL